MTASSAPLEPIASSPAYPLNHGAQEWAAWFWQAFLPGWIARASDAANGGFFDTLDAYGAPVADAPKTVLAQARLLFTFSHVALLSGDAAMRAAARSAHAFLPHFRKASGLYRHAVTRDGRPTGTPRDAVARSYDQSFVILALATWGRLAPTAETAAEMEACWQAIEDHLHDPATGLLLEDDSVVEPSAPEAPPRAQNPHMHLYEAALQAFEMTGETRWLERATHVRGTALRFFLDRRSGTIVEFLSPDLQPLPEPNGMRREIGHQCEWAWLLDREANLASDAAMRATAASLMAFALRHGFAEKGLMHGAAYDAAAADGTWREERFLLWPQTEAIKAYVARHLNGDAQAGANAQALLTQIFVRYFAGRPAFVNQLDATGAVLWPDALSRLLYHLVLALTEGAGAGLWPGPTRILKGGVYTCSI